MKKLFTNLSILLFFSLSLSSNMSFSSDNKAQEINIKNLSGSWVLKDIQTNETVDIYSTPSRMEAITEDNIKKSNAQKSSIPLKKILQAQLSIGNTKFSFNNSTFQFYRKNSLTFSGSWVYSNNTLTLKYGNTNNISNTKLNKIIKLSEKELIMESESYNKKVIFVFSKSN